MSNQPAPLDYLALVLLSLMWGTSFMFVEIALIQFGPLTLTASRIVVAALLLWLATRVTGNRLPTGRAIWLWFLAIGVVGLLVPFSAISWAQQELDSSMAAIMMAITPLTTLFLAHLMTEDEKLGASKLVGLLVGLGGVVVLFDGVSSAGGVSGPRLAAMLIAAVGYALSSVMMKRIMHLPTVSASAGVLIASAILTVPLAFLIENPMAVSYTPGPVGAILFLGFFSSAMATLIMLLLIGRAGVNFMALSSYIVPAIGVVLGVLLLGEKLTAPAILGFVLILAGVAVASVGQRQPTFMPAEAPEPVDNSGQEPPSG